MPYRKVKWIKRLKRCKISVVEVKKLLHFFSVCSASFLKKQNISSSFIFPVCKQKFPTCVRDFESLICILLFSHFSFQLRPSTATPPGKCSICSINERQNVWEAEICGEGQLLCQTQCCLIKKDFGRRENRHKVCVTSVPSLNQSIKRHLVSPIKSENGKLSLVAPNAKIAFNKRAV